MSEKHPIKDWIEEHRPIGIKGVPVAIAVVKIQEAADGLDGPRVVSAWHGGVEVRGWRLKTVKDRQKEDAARQAHEKAAAAHKARETAYREKLKAEQEERDRKQAAALVDQLRKAGYVIVKGGK